MGLLARIKEEWEKSRKEVREKQDKAQNLREQAEGESVNESTLQIGHLELFNEDEYPHHAVYGRTLEIEGGDQKEELTGTGNQKNIAFATNERIIIQSHSGFESGKHLIPYDAINGIDTRERLVSDRVVIQTTGRTYFTSCAFSDQEEIEAFANYVSEMREKVNTSGGKAENSSDSIDQISKLNQLKAEGTISEEEFQNKKEDLLDEI